MSDIETDPSAPSADTGPIGTVRGLVEEHPVAMLAGGILLGALVAGALARPDKDQHAAKPRRGLGRRAMQLAAIGAELAAAYVAGAGSMAEDTAEPAKPSAPAAPEPAKSPAQRLGAMAKSALSTFGPVLTRRLGRNKD